MFILLFIFALFRHLQGAPTSVHSTSACDPTEIFLRDDAKHLGTRQLSDIVISCIATIFACTWTAVHPNIPSPCDSGWEVFKQQITTMIYAILAPEAVTGWALRQNLSARRIAEYYNHEIAKNGRVYAMQRWTPVKISRYLLKHINEGSISAPSITQAEIEDRSKGDGLSKTIVVIQTTWFVTQCIVGWSSSPPVTELEVVTLGFAMLNALTYGLWWNKPQSIALPINLEMKDAVRNETLKPGAEVEEENIATDMQDEQNADNGEQAAPQKENGPPPKRSYLTIKLETKSAISHVLLALW